MTWLQRYRLGHYVRNAIWVWPAVTMAAALIAVRLLHWLEVEMGWEARVSPETARTVLGALAGAMFTFIVFVCSSLLLVVQLASAQLTPRVIGTMFRDRIVKFALAVFLFAFTFSLAAMIRIDDAVPLLISEVAGYGCMVSIAVFLFLIDHVGKMLRPSGVFNLVASEAHAVIVAVYPHKLSDPERTESRILIGTSEPTGIVSSNRGGVVLAFDVKGILALAIGHDCLIELVPQVGNFVAPGDPIFRIYGSTANLASHLRNSIALGYERTIEQDPTFAFRAIVDIASKGLSPAINDPTTAVLAIDRIHHLLRHVGNRNLDNENVLDATGRVRLIYRTPDWEDFVKLAVTEIRQFGGTSIQIARRLRAMLEDLIRSLPEVRAEPLRLELTLLTKSAERYFLEAEDREFAEVSDAQGVGGA
jgi:uncharacterized membrane protein